ncbi:hypothetical protein NQZ68_012939 [Dissostichus eleginoides]|nr:hypothetical protein NQZ68_012939 [Dissostichus eleginoides]
MDLTLPSKNIYDTYKDEIWKELGPLDPDWFESLTAQTFTNEGHFYDQDDLKRNIAMDDNTKSMFVSDVKEGPRSTSYPTQIPSVVSPEAGLDPESHNSPQSSLNLSDSGWKEKLPDAIEDGDIRKTEAIVQH